MIDVAEGDKIPRKGGPGISRSDLLVINKIDLAPHVGADLEVMRRDSLRMRGDRPFLLHQPAARRRRRGDAAMGASQLAITAADFVTPPEFADFAPGQRTRRAGSAASTSSWSSDGHDVRLGRCYQQIPLRVLPPFQFGPGSAGPPVPHQSDRRPVRRRRPSRATRRRKGDADRRRRPVGDADPSVAARLQHAAVGVSRRGRGDAVVLPGPAIPFAGCRCYQHVKSTWQRMRRCLGRPLARGAVCRGDASEWFCFELLMQDLSVRRAGKLIFRDRFCWRGPWDESTAAWHFGGHPAAGSLFISGTLAPEACPGGALFTTMAGDSCVRWHGPGEKVSGAAVRTALIAAAQRSGSPQPWLSTNFDLAPSHWFSLMGERELS